MGTADPLQQETSNFCLPVKLGLGRSKLLLSLVYLIVPKRGGAGRENVITRSSLLKVRHRLAGNRVHGGEGSPWARTNVEAWRWPQGLL